MGRLWFVFFFVRQFVNNYMNNVRWTVVRNSYNSQQYLKKLGLPGSLFVMDTSNTKPSLSFLFPPFLAQNVETYMFVYFVQGTVNKPSPYPPPRKGVGLYLTVWEILKFWKKQNFHLDQEVPLPIPTRNGIAFYIRLSNI